jgi:predicted DNA binding CopG/RHH family protein
MRDVKGGGFDVQRRMDMGEPIHEAQIISEEFKDPLESVYNNSPQANSLKEIKQSPSSRQPQKNAGDNEDELLPEPDNFSESGKQKKPERQLANKQKEVNLRIGINPLVNIKIIRW